MRHVPAVHWSCSVLVLQSLPYCIRTPHSIALRLQPIDEPSLAAAARIADSQKQSGEESKGKARREQPYAEDIEDAEEQDSDSSGSSVWGWLKGLSGAGQQTSAKQVHQVSRDSHLHTLILRCQAGLRLECLGCDKAICVHMRQVHGHATRARNQLHHALAGIDSAFPRQ